MKKRNSLLSKTLLFFLATHSSISYADQFRCMVHATHTLTESGELAGGQDSYYAGSEFTVDRLSGTVIGKVIPTILADNVYVLNAGDGGNSFRSAAVWSNGEAGVRMQLLDIQIWRDGSKKPFAAMSMSGAGVVTGLCEIFCAFTNGPNTRSRCVCI